jgi:two-component system nitrate/nitrite sensor histidine kinase NarX
LPPLAVDCAKHLTEWSHRRGANLVIADLLADEPIPGVDCPVACDGMRSCLFVALRSKDVVIGGLHLLDERPHHFTQADVNTVAALASSASVAIENARLFRRAQTLAALDERQRLAWDLHDGVNQSLFSASLIAEVLPRLWQQDPERGRQSLEDLRRMISGAVAELREVLIELSPMDGDDAGLDVRLRQLSDIFTNRTGTPVTLMVSGDSNLPMKVQTALYRLCQEALNNTAKHARAEHVLIQIQQSAELLELSIRDDGRGFDPQQVPHGHRGLRIMRERAQAIGAELSILSELQQGTEVKIRWTASEK